ncbi:unnamed protein product [Trifolium pratense]|uniref:Uncharacterized protein n=1 Tax=Trifolium pratense TaxID=57577 RepID=A0ACB0JXN6_TRIPR|nr:unnamed protein product [Trifolium pratense]
MNGEANRHRIPFLRENYVAALFGYSFLNDPNDAWNLFAILMPLDVPTDASNLLVVKDLRSGLNDPKVEVDGVVSLARSRDASSLFCTESDENQRPYRQNIVTGFPVLWIFLGWRREGIESCIKIMVENKKKEHAATVDTSKAAYTAHETPGQDDNEQMHTPELMVSTHSPVLEPVQNCELEQHTTISAVRLMGGKRYYC